MLVLLVYGLLPVDTVIGQENTNKDLSLWLIRRFFFLFRSFILLVLLILCIFFGWKECKRNNNLKSINKIQPESMCTCDLTKIAMQF